MKGEVAIDAMERSGDNLPGLLAALAHPQRLRIIAALAEGRNYVSQLAREIGISRPLLHMHLRRLEEAGFVRGTLELSEDGKAMKYFEVTPFAITLTPAVISEAARRLDDGAATGSAGDGGEESSAPGPLFGREEG